MLIRLFLFVIIVIALDCHYNILPMLHCRHSGGEVNSQQVKIGGYIVRRGEGARVRWSEGRGYCIWQVEEEVAWQHMQVGLTDLGGIKSKSSSSGISSRR